MTLSNSFEAEELKRFLFRELGDEELEALEEQFFANDELFYELVDLENELVDSYARNELSAEDKRRFENSLERVPERAEKVANARALENFIKKEKLAAANAVESSISSEKQTAIQDVDSKASLWERISEFFSLKMFTLQYATAALMVLIVAGAGFLVYDRVRLNRELARIKAGQQSRTADLERRSKLLQEQLIQVQQREKTIQTELETSSGQTDILSTQLDRERSERMRLEKELERLRNEKGNVPPLIPGKDQNRPPQPVIASIVLSPSAGTRGGGGVKTVEIPTAAQQITVTLQIPRDSAANSFDVKFGGITVGSGVKHAKTASGRRYVVVSLAAKRLSADKNNEFDVTGDDGKSYKFVFRLKKR